MTFEAYKVAIKLSLINNVSSGLVAISHQLMKTNKDVDTLHARLQSLQKITLLGAAASGAGIFGLGMIGKAIKPAEEYIHQLNIMNMAGMKQAEIAEAVGDAWKLAGQNVTTTATGNLKALLDLRNVTGDWKEAREFLPIMQRMQTVLAASKDENVRSHAGDLAFSAMKALDIRGAVNDPESLKRQADLMTRVIIGTQGRVTPEQFQSVMNYSRQAKFSLSDDFLYKYLPVLMLENATKGGGGGGSKGVGPALAAMYRVTNQGFINRKSIGEWEALGEVVHGSALKTATPGTVVAPLVDAALARSNPLLFNDLLVEKIRKKYGESVTDDFISSKLTDLYRGNQLAAGLAVEMFIKRKNFERERRNIEGVMSPEDAYKNAMTKDPATAHRALSAAWENFQTSLTVNVVPVLVPALFKLSRGLNDLGDFARRHPNMTKDLVIGFGAVAGVLAVGGPLITGLAIAKVAFGDVGGVLSKGAAGTAGGVGGMLSSVATGLGKIFAVTGAFAAGYGAGSWLNDNVINPGVEKLTGQKGQTLGGWIYDKTHKDYDPNQGSRFVQGKIRQPIEITVVSKLNDREIARAVTSVQDKEGRRPPTGGSSFDGSMAPRPVGAGAMGGW